jgi:hypothetical protein
VGIAWSKDPESYAGSIVATGRASHAGLVKGDDPDDKAYSGPPVWGLGVGLANSANKQHYCHVTSTGGQVPPRNVQPMEEEEEEEEEEECKNTPLSLSYLKIYSKRTKRTDRVFKYNLYN